MPGVRPLTPHWGIFLLLTGPLFCTASPGVAAAQAVAQESATQDLAAIRQAIDELPTLPPARQKPRAEEIVETYYPRYSDAVDYPDFEPIRDLKRLLDGIDELPTLSVRQQQSRAAELVSRHSDDFPGFFPVAELERHLAEVRAFDAMDRVEQSHREAASEWARHYWQSRCCPLPPWEPPVGRLRNETGLSVLYEQCLEGIHDSRWSGPYRLADGGEHSSPHPFHVRYLTQGTVQTVRIAPGQNYAFRGSPADGTLALVPSSVVLPADANGDLTLPAPAPAVTADPAVPVEPSAPVPVETPALLPAPMIAP